MDYSRLRRYAAGLFPVLVALTAGPGMLKAANLLVSNPTSVTLACSTVTGPASTTIVVRGIAAPGASSPLSVTITGLTGGITVSPSGAQALTSANNTAGLTYTVSLAPGCVGVANNGTPALHFNTGAGVDIIVTVNTTLAATVSGLSVSPSPIILSCTKNGGVYTPPAVSTVSITSQATGGTPFTVDSSGTAVWLTVGAASGATATTTATTFTLTVAGNCGSFASGTSNPTTILLVNAPGPQKAVTVTLLVVPPSTLTTVPAAPTLTYVKGSGSAGKVDVTVSAAGSPAPFFSLDTSSLPIWLTVDAINGTVPKSIRFSSTNVSDSLAPGTYSASVRLTISGQAALSVPITFLVTNKSSRLSVVEGTKRDLSWTLGQPLPTPTVTALSTDTPIAYTATTGGTLAPIISAIQQSGLAYSFGTPIGITFNPLLFASAQPGSVLTGTVTLTWGTPASTIVVTFNITVVSPGSTITSLSPATVPTAPVNSTVTVSISGTGFVTSTDPSQKTRVGIVTGSSNQMITDTAFSVNVVNPSNIILTITVPASDANLPFAPSGAGGPVVIGVCNPAGSLSGCNIATGQQTLTIGSNPIIQSVTASSSLIQVGPGATPSVAPYDMISIFGANFCASGGTGCGTNTLLIGQPDALTSSFSTALTPDVQPAAPASPISLRQLSVTFWSTAGTPVLLGTAPLLFANNSQINALVPSGVFGQIGSTVSVVVTFGYGSGATMKTSLPFAVNIVATNPGIFTIGADGQGDGAALDRNYSLVGVNNPGGVRSTPSDSDTLQLYMTGLGAPDSAASNGSAGSGAWSADCVSAASFLSSFNSQTANSLATLDGTLMLPSVFNTGRLAPCTLAASANVPTVTIGGVPGTVTYAGWVPSAVVGLYQLNVLLPGSSAGTFTNTAGQAINTIIAPVQLPVVVTANSRTSQAGVSLWLTPRLLVTPPSGGGLTGTVGVDWSGSNNTVDASEGTPTYRYSVTSGLLPSGLSLSPSTGAISGKPAANTSGSYVVTVTATDSASFPVKGTTTFTLTIAGGLYMTSSGNAPYHATFGTANNSVTTVTATSGVFPYTFAITAPGSVPTGMTITSGGVLKTSVATPAGTYQVTVGATDSTSGTPLTGGISFDVVEALRSVVHAAPVDAAAGVASTIVTIDTTGMTGTLSYTLDAATVALGFVSIDAGGIVTVDSTCTAGTRSVTVTVTDGTAPANASAAGTGSVTFTLKVL